MTSDVTGVRYPECGRACRRRTAWERRELELDEDPKEPSQATCVAALALADNPWLGRYIDPSRRPQRSQSASGGAVRTSQGYERSSPPAVATRTLQHCLDGAYAERLAMRTTLAADLATASTEFVLVQAWKKASAHVRTHNWYSDTLELDRLTIDLPRFLRRLGRDLVSPQTWVPTPLRLIPAPKSQRWRVDATTGQWLPEDTLTSVPLRPLAHVSMRDQVAATALLLCLADRVETAQGDPRLPPDLAPERRRLVSFGNRLFCDNVRGRLTHRWGSRRLYRGYYQDYRAFLVRPDTAARAAALESGADRILIVKSDLRQFYDRVSTGLLTEKLLAISQPEDDPAFIRRAAEVLSWPWNRQDQAMVREHASAAELTDFSRIALPQGLVASGFFSNLVLLDFDDLLRQNHGAEILSGLFLVDAARYVDDLRLVLTYSGTEPTDGITPRLVTWLQRLLDRSAHGLQVSLEKTVTTAFKGDGRPLLHQARKMAWIQQAVSGGFDAVAGQEILVAVQGLVRRQQAVGGRLEDADRWRLAPVPDVRDDTVARFAAGRYRTTYRSIRPLLLDSSDSLVTAEGESDETTLAAGSQSALDEDSRAFALGLIDQWISDPSNVRLLRIGLDLWPSEEVITSVLDLIRPWLLGPNTRHRHVALYCMAEIFRAAATETGMVEDPASLPAGVDLGAYRAILRTEASTLLEKHGVKLPWFLTQQALLVLAVNRSNSTPDTSYGRRETATYVSLLKYLSGSQTTRLSNSERAVHAVLARRSFVNGRSAAGLAADGLSVRTLSRIAALDPLFALEMCAERPDVSRNLPSRTQLDLSMAHTDAPSGFVPLSELVLSSGTQHSLRGELSLLSFAVALMPKLRGHGGRALRPGEVHLSLLGNVGVPEVKEVQVVAGPVGRGSIYEPPRWADSEERWRFQLGYLLRFMLTAQPDFTIAGQRPSWRESSEVAYRPARSHWYQRVYGMFNAHSGFGDDWVPVSEWFEGLLSALLRWPGARASAVDDVVRLGRTAARMHILERIGHLRSLLSSDGRMLILPRRVSSPEPRAPVRPLRACIVQTVIPGPDTFAGGGDLGLNDPVVRRAHRNHLSAALAAVRRMLTLRETHKSGGGGLDLLVLPELSVHPQDVRTHLEPFARAHKTIILAGLVYEALGPGQPLVNSALWLIPSWSPTNGLRILRIRQGKEHLAPAERSFTLTSPPLLRSFRPCQWLIGYDWGTDVPLWLTASVCYDATDLRLAADLSKRSDVFLIPALNKDVNTFDQMALALHYHMYQLVVVANNGQYGGSNAYMPLTEHFERQVFHLHGQPQASIAFVEIEDIAGFVSRRLSGVTPATVGSPPRRSRWKYPPAGH